MDISKLFNQQQKALLKKNREEKHCKNNPPVAYLQIINLGYSFLLTEWDSKQTNKAFGLINYDTDLKIGEVDLHGLIKIAEANQEEISSQWNFEGKYNLAVYAKVAETIGAIVTDSSEEGYREDFEKFALGKNIDQELDLRYFRNILTWI